MKDHCHAWRLFTSRYSATHWSVVRQTDFFPPREIYVVQSALLSGRSCNPLYIVSLRSPVLKIALLYWKRCLVILPALTQMIFDHCICWLESFTVESTI